MSSSGFKNVGSFIRDCNGTTLRYDQACFEIISSEAVNFWSQTVDCIGCPLLRTAEVFSARQLIVQTLNPIRYAFKNSLGQICNGKWKNPPIFVWMFCLHSLSINPTHTEHHKILDLLQPIRIDNFYLCHLRILALNLIKLN